MSPLRYSHTDRTPYVDGFGSTPNTGLYDTQTQIAVKPYNICDAAASPSLSSLYRPAALLAYPNPLVSFTGEIGWATTLVDSGNPCDEAFDYSQGQLDRDKLIVMSTRFKSRSLWKPRRRTWLSIIQTLGRSPCSTHHPR